MLRIIHSADWHIGQTLNGHAREHEHAAVLAELAQIAQAREADALIVAGDIFDHQNPSGDAQRVYFEALRQLREARPQMAIVITAGNHDAAGRIEAPRALLGAAGIHVVGSVRRVGGRIDAGRHLVTLKDSAGRDAALVLAVSYPTVACLPAMPAAEAAGSSPIAAATEALYAELMESARRKAQGLPIIVTGHLHVAGAIESEGAERRILVGGQHAVSPDVFPIDAAYVALGHLHKAQRVGRDTIRYSGSLLPLSATELGYSHGVTLLTLEGGKARMEEIALTRPVPFLRVPERGEIRIDKLAERLEALDLDATLADEMRPFVQVCLSREGLSAGYRATLDKIGDEYPLRLVDPKVAPLPEAAVFAVGEPIQKLAELKPDDLFAKAFERALGRAPSAEHLAAFHHALSTVER